jgi:prevent-host-death family protein
VPRSEAVLGTGAMGQQGEAEGQNVDGLARTCRHHECGHNGLMEVSVRELKDHLSEYLRRVERGERLVVTDRKRPIAEIGPVTKEQMTEEQWVAFLDERGELTRARRPRKFANVKPTRIRGTPLSRTILDDRR